MVRRRDPLSPPRHGLPGLALVGLVLAAGTAAAQPRGHVHGQATLRVAVDGGTVAVELEAPLEGLLGFERQPRTAAERVAVDALRARFAAPGELFRLDPAARCTVASASVVSPLHGTPPAGPSPGPSGVSRPRDAGIDPGDHADLQATVAFTCAEPTKLRALEVRLFADHPNLARIRVETVGTGGPARRELRRGAATVPLGRPG